MSRPLLHWREIQQSHTISIYGNDMDFALVSCVKESYFIDFIFFVGAREDLAMVKLML